jgi:hypothetical protein
MIASASEIAWYLVASIASLNSDQYSGKIFERFAAIRHLLYDGPGTAGKFSRRYWKQSYWLAYHLETHSPTY